MSFCIGAARRAARGGLWMLLAVQLLVCVGFLRNDSVSLPRMPANALKGLLKNEGLWLEFENASFTTAGWLCLQRPRVFADAQKKDLLFAAETVAVRPDWLKVPLGKFEIERLDIVDGEIGCPAFLSPNGRAETPVRDLNVRARMSQNRLHAAFSGTLFNAHIEGAGDVLLPRGTPTANAPKAKTRPVEAVANALTPLLRARATLAQFNTPRARLAARVDAPRQATDFTLEVSADSWRDNAVRARTGPLSLRLRARLEDGNLRPIDVSEISAERIAATVGDGAAARTVVIERLGARLEANPHGGAKLENAFTRADAVLSHIRGFDAAVDLLSVRADFAAFPNVSLSARVLAGTGAVDAQATVDTAKRSGVLTVSGAVDPRALLPPDFIRDEGLKRVRFGAPPEWSVRAVFAEGARFERADAAVRLYQTDYDSVHIKGALALCAVTPQTLDAHTLRLWGDGFALGGQYLQNFSRGTYRFLLRGTIPPNQLDALMEPWWQDIWREFDIAGNPPYADIDFGGQWGNDLDSKLVGRVRLNDFIFRGERWRTGDVGLRITPDYTAIDDIALVCDKGTLCGDFRWFYKNDMRPRLMFSQQLSIRSTLPLDLLGTVGGEDVAAITRELRSAAPPVLSGEFYTWGVGSAVAGECFIALDVGFPEKGAIFNIPVDTVSLHVRIDNRRVEITDIDLGLAGGRMTGALTLSQAVPAGTRADFAFVLDGANHLRFLDDIALMSAADEVRAHPRAPRPPLDADETAARQTGALRLDAKGTGVFGRADTFNGSGAFSVVNADIGRLDLLGGLSRALDSVGLPSGQLRFTDAASSLSLENGVLVFPDLSLSGKTAKVDAAGRLSLVDHALNFRLHFYPFGSMKAPLMQFVFKAVHPLSNTFALTLDGSLKNPEWHMEFSPSQLLEFDFVAPEMPDAATDDVKNP